MLKYKKSVVESLLTKLKEINIARLNRKVIYEKMGEIRLRTTSNEYTLYVKTSYIEIWNAGKKLYSKLPTVGESYFRVKVAL